MSSTIGSQASPCSAEIYEPEIVFTHLVEGIGLALDVKGPAYVPNRPRW